uniref:tRNA pseudouridine synthase B n=1 Tax=uncultured gamma proteobacterium HF0070_08D07 TaxID=710983 RepID=E0XRW4_9GAMM|nr:pseudouridine synthase [uncultured gamma proteobacterium HF0070_08D07]
MFQSQDKIDGFIALDKPKGPTSHATIQDLKKRFGLPKIGHAGTLDPMATGLLLLCIGEATKFSRFLIEADKAYVAEIVLGESTDTYDADGQITEKKLIKGITNDSVERALCDLRGAILQKPPMFSAKKIKGRRLYNLARQGKEIEREELPVIIYKNKLLELQGRRLSLEIECSKGTYIRSIAHDLGQRLGCGAHLGSLRRTKVGKFSEHDMVSAHDLSHSESLNSFVSPIGSALSQLPSLVLKADDCVRLLNGQQVVLEKKESHGFWVLYESSNESQKRFIGVGEVKDHRVLRPMRMIAVSR